MEKQQIHIVEWNINQRSAYYNKEIGIPGFVVAELKRENADIIVLTEYKHCKSFEDTLREIGYNIFTSDIIPKGNEILIGIREFKFIGQPVENKVLNTSIKEQPNFLQVSVKIEGKPVTIIGVRIRVDKGSRKDYLERKEQLSALTEHLATLDNSVIVVGDFNNSIIRGDERKSYSEVRKDYRYTKKGERSVLFDTYNYHILKDCLAAQGVILFTPEGNRGSWGYSEKYGWNATFKQDHIATKGIIAEKVMVYPYNEDFIRANNYFENDEKLEYNKYGDKVIASPYPDHAILSAVIELPIE